jgi:hypothetical protein
MEKVRYEEMLPHEIVARRKNFPAAFMGLGGLEWHGEHLAAGNVFHKVLSSSRVHNYFHS